MSRSFYSLPVRIFLVMLLAVVLSTSLLKSFNASPAHAQGTSNTHFTFKISANLLVRCALGLTLFVTGTIVTRNLAGILSKAMPLWNLRQEILKTEKFMQEIIRDLNMGADEIQAARKFLGRIVPAEDIAFVEEQILQAGGPLANKLSAEQRLELIEAGQKQARALLKQGKLRKAMHKEISVFLAYGLVADVVTGCVDLVAFPWIDWVANTYFPVESEGQPGTDGTDTINPATFKKELKSTGKGGSTGGNLSSLLSDPEQLCQSLFGTDYDADNDACPIPASHPLGMLDPDTSGTNVADASQDDWFDPSYLLTSVPNDDDPFANVGFSG